MPDGIQLQEAAEAPPEKLEVTEAQQDLDRAAYDPEEAKEAGDYKQAEVIVAELIDIMPEKSTLERGEAKSGFEKTGPSETGTTDQGEDTGGKTAFGESTSDPGDDYSGVEMAQGEVAQDSDWNEDSSVQSNEKSDGEEIYVLKPDGNTTAQDLSQRVTELESLSEEQPSAGETANTVTDVNLSPDDVKTNFEHKLPGDENTTGAVAANDPILSGETPQDTGLPDDEGSTEIDENSGETPGIETESSSNNMIDFTGILEARQVIPLSEGSLAAPFIPGGSVLSAAMGGGGQQNDIDWESSGESSESNATGGESERMDTDQPYLSGPGNITVGGVEAVELDIPETYESTQIDEFSDPNDLMEGRERPDDTPEEAAARAEVEEAQDKAAKAERVNDALARAEAKYEIAHGEAINAIEAYKDAVAEYQNKLVEFFNSLSPNALAQFDSLTLDQIWNSIDVLWHSIDVSEESEECQALYQELADAHEVQADTLAEANKAADALNDAKAEVEDLKYRAAKAEAEAAAAAKDAVVKVTGKDSQ